MVEIKIPKKFKEQQKNENIINQLNQIKIDKYKIKATSNNIGNIKIMLKSFFKYYKFTFKKLEEQYTLILPKISKKGILLSKLLEKISGCKVEIILNKDEEYIFKSLLKDSLMGYIVVTISLLIFITLLIFYSKYNMLWGVFLFGLLLFMLIFVNFIGESINKNEI